MFGYNALGSAYGSLADRDNGQLANQGRGQLTSRGYGQLVSRREHFVFLIDTSGSMRTGGVASHFAKPHEELLDTLADAHPGAVVSCITFNEEAHVQYISLPIEQAPSLTMAAKWGTDLPVAVCTELAKTVEPRIKSEDITIVIVTDGDTESHTKSGYTPTAARRLITMWRKSGVRFLFLVALDGSENTATYGGPLAYAQGMASLIGILPNEVMLWGHTAQDLSKAFGKVGEKLALGAAKSG